MTTTAAALALKEQATVLAGSISSLFATCDEDGDAAVHAKILSTIGRVDALRFARTQDAFEATFELLATRRFFLEFVKLVNDEHVQRLVRCTSARELAGHAPVTRNAKAAALGDDLVERYELLVKLVAQNRSPTNPPSKVLEGLAAWTAAVTGIRLAAHVPDQWADWMVGMMWNFGRRALVDVAHVAGASWEAAIDGLTTSRDRALFALPFDPVASDEAAKLLGLQ